MHSCTDFIANFHYLSLITTLRTFHDESHTALCLKILHELYINAEEDSNPSVMRVMDSGVLLAMEHPRAQELIECLNAEREKDKEKRKRVRGMHSREQEGEQEQRHRYDQRRRRREQEHEVQEWDEQEWDELGWDEDEDDNY